MTRIVIDIPTERLKSFLHLMTEFGMETAQATSNLPSVLKKKIRRKRVFLRPQRFPLHNWEAFRNELEFE